MVSGITPFGHPSGSSIVNLPNNCHPVLDPPSSVGDSGFIAHNPDMVCDDDPLPISHPPHLPSPIPVDVTTSPSSIGLDPSKHSAVLFKIDQASLDEGNPTGFIETGSKVSKGVRLSKSAASSNGSSKILKNFKIAQGPDSKFKAGNNNRILLKDSMNQLAKVISSPTVSVTGVNLVLSEKAKMRL